MKKSIILVILFLFVLLVVPGKVADRVEYFYKGHKISEKEFKTNGENGKILVYYNNGRKEEETHWQKGKRHGTCKYWFENGKIKNNEEYMQGMAVGHWIEWFKNGNKRYELEHKEGKIVKFTWWYENGRKRRETSLKNGRSHGSDTYWYTNGRKNFVREYKNGLRQGKWLSWFADGMKKGAGEFPAGTGKWIEWHKKGTKKREAEFKDGEKHGKETGWYRNGNKRFESNYLHGQQNGSGYEWYENGEIKSEGEYSQGRRHGKWVEWYQSGGKKKERNFDNWIPHGKWLDWYEMGGKKFAGEYKKGKRHGKWIEWYEKGKVKGQGDFNEGSGKWVEYYENGKKKREEEWQNGMREGKWLCLDKKGNITKEETWKENQLVEVTKGKTLKILGEEIKRIVKEHTNPDFEAGVIIGIVNGSKRHVFSFGKKAGRESEAPDADTIFEIGSITKTFTGIILADMYLKGEIDLDDPAGKFLPGNVKMPTHEGKEITLRNLASHSSSLPNMADNYPESIVNPADVCSTYTKYHMYCFLNNFTISRPIGKTGDYSNMGMALLAHILGRLTNTTYEDLLRHRLLDVLGMNNSTVAVTEKQKSNLALGHLPDGTVTPNWTLTDFLQGSGAIKSSLNDMFKYLEANMGLRGTPLKQAVELSQRPVIKTIWGDTNCLGWGLETLSNGEEVIWHNGGTEGYRAFTAFIKRLKVGVIVLSNFRDTNQNAIGWQILALIQKY